MTEQETVTIPKAKYNDLVRSSNRLAALEAAGVDNWGGYDHAMQVLHGDEDDD
jgi:hypothetical protein